jgi:twitching motility two-component system response regulator PilG
MSDIREFKIHLIGISDSDRQILIRILKLRHSPTSLRNYVLSDHAEPEENKIYIVNSDCDKSLAYWSERHLSISKIPKVPTIFAGARRIKCNNTYSLNLPFRATSTLSTLDMVTVRDLDYIPELTISKAAHANGNDKYGEAQNLSERFLEEIANSKGNRNQTIKAMVVDDSRPVRKQLEIQLKMLGVSVELAENGEQAIELSKGNEYDIIFLDVVMPGIDGYKVCKHLKQNNRSKGTPVIMLTGKSSPFDKVKGTLSGCDTYLTKPLEHEEFQSIARKYLPHTSMR